VKLYFSVTSNNGKSDLFTVYYNCCNGNNQEQLCNCKDQLLFENLPEIVGQPCTLCTCSTINNSLLFDMSISEDRTGAQNHPFSRMLTKHSAMLL